ncbi:unnamed protein product [Vitrella brassicaformis CCMP3155]|uniref:Secreted protein n=1 Tax=Vitrella brassicaformis (strain CCMP3155) TaxID=1169540 RepID=A0A0G4F416_VITBC|nr:unnamed protein product [Vitrella brassicaformis CCMP3155]|mmetsp:Transcript_7650/g.18730  ORF Transcript_7650/g.18730 Transcript_7650/m.18730 type:complete len:187 (-) Transcript_7650:281-841(-)|eukprot:CEM06456.1 unnamed protein product [Vitrella brassicaformis CCMP3155]
MTSAFRCGVALPAFLCMAVAVSCGGSGNESPLRELVSSNAEAAEGIFHPTVPPQAGDEQVGDQPFFVDMENPFFPDMNEPIKEAFRAAGTTEGRLQGGQDDANIPKLHLFRRRLSLPSWLDCVARSDQDPRNPCVATDPVPSGSWMDDLLAIPESTPAPEDSETKDDLLALLEDVDLAHDHAAHPV